MIFVSSKTSDGNMSLIHGNHRETLLNRERFFKSLSINPKDVAEVSQTHGNKIILIRDVTASVTEKADGMITDKIGIYLMVKVADCIPIGLYDPDHHAIGLIHMGRRGLETGIIKNAIKKMAEHFDLKPKDLIVRFGPSIGPCHYCLDLWTQAKDQLIILGVLKENIDNPKICTYENKDYFSHRRSVDENLPNFRFVTILGLN